MAGDPLQMMEIAYDMIWSGADPSAILLLPEELQAKYARDTAALELARAFKVNQPPRKRGVKMSTPTITTVFGSFTSEMVSDLRKTLEACSEMDRQQIVMWNGQQVQIAFGWYLVEYVEMELATRQSTQGGL